jgi:hypothetical protein
MYIHVTKEAFGRHVTIANLRCYLGVVYHLCLKCAIKVGYSSYIPSVERTMFTELAETASIKKSQLCS